MSHGILTLSWSVILVSYGPFLRPVTFQELQELIWMQRILIEWYPANIIVFLLSFPTNIPWK